MADDADLAQDFEERLIAEAIHRAKKLARNRASEWFCVDCDGVIPHERRAFGGVIRCVECQTIFESKNKKRAIHFAREANRLMNAWGARK